MTNEEKFKLIKRLTINLSPIDIVDKKVAQGVGHALAVAIECVIDMDSEVQDEAVSKA